MCIRGDGDMTEAVEPARDEGYGQDSTRSEGDLTSLVRRWVATPRVSRADRARASGEGPEAEAQLTPPTRLPTRRPWSVQRQVDDEPRPERNPRLAVLIDTQTTPPETADGLLDVLGDMGSVSVRRGYADWTRPDMDDWLGRLREHGIQPVHHFSEVGTDPEDGQALVSMTVDAVDLARESAVDVVVVVGDLRSVAPLVTRLHASGVRVVAVGPGHTPYDVRAASDDFIDFATLTDRTGAGATVGAGRHRA